MCVCLHVVRANLYHLLGVFASVYPEHMVKYANKLLEFYVGVLKAEVNLLLVFNSIIFCFFGCGNCLEDRLRVNIIRTVFSAVLCTTIVE